MFGYKQATKHRTQKCTKRDTNAINHTQYRIFGRIRMRWIDDTIQNASEYCRSRERNVHTQRNENANSIRCFNAYA